MSLTQSCIHEANGMNGQIQNNRLMESSGFTLLELVLATMISALVVGILTTALSFSLRLWERQQNQKTSEMPQLLELMKWQLANFDPVPVATGEGNQAHMLFIGDQFSLAFATDHSVKALSKGVPIIARYVYSQSEKKLYYAERPLDPYHSDDIKQFLKMKPEEGKTWPQFFPTSVADFSFSYRGGGEKKGESWTAWEEEDAIPSIVTVEWTPGQGAESFKLGMTPNFMLAANKDAAQKARSQTQHSESGSSSQEAQ